MTPDDVSALRSFYEAARESIGHITRPNGIDPKYPKEVLDLVAYIAQSDWCEPRYTDFNYGDIQRAPELRSVDEIRAAITAFSRGERFCTGFWAQSLEKDWLGGLIRRAEEIHS